jgi:alpha-glucuronidase
MLLFLAILARGEDGSLLWLRYPVVDKPPNVTSNHDSPTVHIAVTELRTHWSGGPVDLRLAGDSHSHPDSYRISGSPKSSVTVTAPAEQGLLYAAYHLLRLQACGNLSATLSISESPCYHLRLLNHFDNLDGSITRGYAGHSIWKWGELPETVSPRYTAYARANAAIGINGATLTNVDASPQVLTSTMLIKTAAIANVLRPYHIRVYIAINFASPQVIGGLSTSDPLDATVVSWWRSKVAEIYGLIPDFGGFLVKANSEGQPGPQDFGRTHADGANILADIVSPYGGVVMWRAFVYSPNGADRAKQAYDEFAPLDGTFAPNVFIQVKNGPVDYQPREPFSPLFGGLRRTAVAVEFQITQEYLGQANHIAFLPVLQKEVLESDTFASGPGTTVASLTTAGNLTAIAGVSNIGEDPN